MVVVVLVVAAWGWGWGGARLLDFELVCYVMCSHALYPNIQCTILEEMLFGFSGLHMAYLNIDHQLLMLK
jgi:hypothetical protein